MTTAQQDKNVLPDINTRYVYVLASKNEPRGKVYDENGNRRAEQEYKPYMNVILRSSVVWPGGKDPFSNKERAAGRYGIRYYDGCTTLFMDDQPQDKDTLDSLIASTREMIFTNGFCYIFGYDTFLKLYFDWCSYNEDSPYRVPSVEVKFKAVNTEKAILAEGELMEIEDNARDLAKKASVKKMRIHAHYLGIATEDPTTSQLLSDEAVRVEYRKSAKSNPKDFIMSYNDKSIEMKTWITEAINTGLISTTLIPNKVVWAKGGAIIMDVSGIKSLEIINDKLVEFSQTEEGSDFSTQIKALYN